MSVWANWELPRTLISRLYRPFSFATSLATFPYATACRPAWARRVGRHCRCRQVGQHRSRGRRGVLRNRPPVRPFRCWRSQEAQNGLFWGPGWRKPGWNPPIQGVQVHTEDESKSKMKIPARLLLAACGVIRRAPPGQETTPAMTQGRHKASTPPWVDRKSIAHPAPGAPLIVNRSPRSREPRG